MSMITSIPPSFIGIGAMRCGTTWISDMLRAHPDIYIPAHFKELHFFDRYFDKGTDWYFANFSDKGEDQIAGEFTPAYLRGKQALGLIAETCPDARLIISLRNPIARAISHYTFLKNRKSISSSFYDALLDPRFEILKAGLFGEQVQKCLELFPPENVHIIIFDDIKTRPEQVLSDLYQFLGVKADFIPEGISQKSNAKHGVKFKMIAGIVQQIKHLLRSFVKGREGLIKIGFFKLGRLLNRWNSVSVPQFQIDKQANDYLKTFYQDDLNKLNTLLSGRVSHWL